jgi:hypothetical protein
MELEGTEYTLSAESIYRHAYSPAGRRSGLPRNTSLDGYTDADITDVIWNLSFHTACPR